MLVHVDSSVLDLVRQEQSSALRFTEYAGMAHREGKHIICGEPNTLKGIGSCKHVNPTVRGAFQGAASRCAEANGLKRVLPFYVEAGHGNDFLNLLSGDPGRRILKLDINWFDDSAAVQRPVLLAENLRDAQVYTELAKSLVSARKWKLRIQIETRGAGGSNVSREFANAVRAKVPCLCIVDSDRCCPSCRIGSTARGVTKVGELAGVHHSVIIQERELENLLPFEVLKMALGSSATSELGAYSSLLELSRDAAMFVDLKKGLRAGDIRKMKDRPAERDFWEEVDRHAQAKWPRYRHCSNVDECVDPLCSCVLLPPMGDSVLDQVLAAFDVQPARLSNAVGAADLGSVERVCMDVIAFGCALSPSRT